MVKRKCRKRRVKRRTQPGFGEYDETLALDPQAMQEGMQAVKQGLSTAWKRLRKKSVKKPEVISIKGPKHTGSFKKISKKTGKALGYKPTRWRE